MCKLFEQIAQYWQLEMPSVGQESQLLVFIQNRIKLDLNYYIEYKNAVHVIKELCAVHGDPQGYIQLLTDPSGLITPATTPIARARQKVSNEFITLALAIGGFKTFGAKNALGYISGGNIENNVPYRVFKDV